MKRGTKAVFTLALGLTVVSRTVIAPAPVQAQITASQVVPGAGASLEDDGLTARQVAAAAAVGAVEGAVDGAADGHLVGALTGALTGALVGAIGDIAGQLLGGQRAAGEEF